MRDVDEGFHRIKDHAFPLEDVRMQSAHALRSEINKILVVNREGKRGRTTLMFVKERLGF